MASSDSVIRVIRAPAGVVVFADLGLYNGLSTLYVSPVSGKT
jgi:hypothetical protein